MPVYRAPDFTEERFANAPDAAFAVCDMDGVAPDGYHSTSMYPEYFKIDGQWRLAEESRMDCTVVLRDSGVLDVVEQRNLRTGDRVALGRSEDGHEGVFLHADGFHEPDETIADQFAFRAVVRARRRSPRITTVCTPCFGMNGSMAISCS